MPKVALTTQAETAALKVILTHVTLELVRSRSHNASEANAMLTQLREACLETVENTSVSGSAADIDEEVFRRAFGDHVELFFDAIWAKNRS